MSFASKVLYTGDGSTKSFNIPMPYISTSHIKVFVNEILLLLTMDYTLSGASTVLFGTAPGIDDAIVIKRETSPNNILVDFQDGSVLNESDLDTAYLHTYYLSQEYADGFNEMINEAFLRFASGAGIVETETDAIIAALVEEMLNTDAAANLQARITDIDLNAEAILTLGEGLQVQINTLAQGIAATVYLDDNEPVPGVPPYPNPIPEGARWYDTNDNNAPYIYVSSEWLSLEDPRIGQAAADISVLQVDVVDNAAAVVAEAFVRATNDTAIASELHLVGAQNAGKTAFIIDLDTAKVGPTESLAERFTALSAASAANAADIISEAIVAANATGAVAGTVTTLTTEVDDNTASVATHATSINGIEAEYGVDLNVNGYVTGFRILNGGTPGDSAFVILANKFAIVDPSGDPGETEFIPMQIVDGKVRFNTNVEIDGNLVVSGTINGSALIDGTIGTTQIGPNAIYSAQISADQITTNHLKALAVTADKISVTNLAAVSGQMGTLAIDDALTMGTSGHMKGGQTAYATGTGFWLGYDSGDYKFSIGNSSNYLTWDGSTLEVKGDLVVGEYISSANIILSAITERTDSGPFGGYQTYKSFTVAKDGVVRLTVDYKNGTFSGGTITACNWRVTVNGVQDDTWGSSTQTTYITHTHVVTGLSAGDIINIDMIGGERNPSEPIPVNAYMKNAYIKADVIIAPGGTVNLD